jgi:outer membrane protein OmpA-like peptidoglycan-associated protein
VTHILSTTLVLAFFASISWGQHVSLSGVVRDREDKSPIRGAEVKVGSKVGGITGADGKYVVSDLPRGAKVEVAYTKQGYGSRIEQIMLTDERIREDVALFKNTADAVYWSSWSDNLRKEVQAQGSDPRSQSEEYIRQWKEVQEAGLTNEARDAAARQLIIVFPSQSAVPADLQARAIDGLRKEANQDRTVYAHAQQRQAAGNKDQIAENQQQIESDMRAYQANKQATDAEISANQAANQAAIAAAKQEIAANQASIDQVAQDTRKRFSELGDFVVQGEHTVYFKAGQYSISAEDKQALADLAKQALTYPKGYAIQVAAFADSAGTAASNQVLSRERAQAVVAYLLQECNVPVGRIVAPGAMGETNPVGSNETASGRSQNRRAEVKLLVNCGAGGGA